jgi:hypothetical protein
LIISNSVDLRAARAANPQTASQLNTRERA